MKVFIIYYLLFIFLIYLKGWLIHTTKPKIIFHPVWSHAGSDIFICWFFLDWGELNLVCVALSIEFAHLQHVFLKKNVVSMCYIW